MGKVPVDVNMDPGAKTTQEAKLSPFVSTNMYVGPPSYPWEVSGMDSDAGGSQMYFSGFLMPCARVPCFHEKNPILAF